MIAILADANIEGYVDFLIAVMQADRSFQSPWLGIAQRVESSSSQDLTVKIASPLRSNLQRPGWR